MQLENFIPNPDLERELHKFPDVVASTDDVANEIAERARDLAPVESGAYRDGIIVQKSSPKGVARVLATDQKSAWIEFGNGRSIHAQFVMRTAVESLGLKFKKGR
jgi:hypothetical protein